MSNRHTAFIKISFVDLCALLVLIYIVVSVHDYLDTYYPSEVYDEYTADLTMNFSGGDGSESDPYRISSLDDLVALSELIKDRENRLASTEGQAPRLSKAYKKYSHAYYIQTADIDASSIEEWQPIGSNYRKPFGGVYDGGGYKISNVRYRGMNHRGDGKSAGIFGYVSGVIKRVNVENMNEQVFYDMRGMGSSIGMIAGTLVEGSIGAGKQSGFVEKCSSSGFFNLKLYNGQNLAVGGIVGVIGYKGKVLDCESRTVFNYDNSKDTTVPSSINRCFLGGIVGQIDNGTVEGCRNEGKILFSAKGASFNNIGSLRVGGIAGSGDKGPGVRYIVIERCINAGDINIEGGGGDISNVKVGGIVGSCREGRIYRSSNRGSLFVNPTKPLKVEVGGITSVAGDIKESSNFGNIRTVVGFINKEDPFIKDDSGIRELIATIYCGGIFAIGSGGPYLNLSNAGDISIHTAIEGMKSEMHIGGIGGTIGAGALKTALNAGLIDIEKVSSITRSSVGYIVGSMPSGGLIIDCYWLDTSGGASKTSGIGNDHRKGGSRKDVLKMLSPKEISDINSYPGWNFENIWEIPESCDRIPRLRNTIYDKNFKNEE
jgi:hypothetical protein